MIPKPFAGLTSDGKNRANSTEAFLLPGTVFRDWGSAPWTLHPAYLLLQKLNTATPYTAARILAPDQGVTVGGENVLDLFRLSDDEKRHLTLEEDVWRKGLKGADVERWRIEWKGLWFIYPYARSGYTLFHGEVSGSTIDLLSFDDPLLDGDEKGIVHRYDHSAEGLERLINHRVAKYGLPLQNTARYLARHYPELSERVFKQRNIRTFGRQWYEYIWPRTPQLMLAHNKIVTPRLVRTAEFAWDGAGYLPQDSLIALGIPRSGDRKRTYDDFRDQLVKNCGDVTSLDVLRYCLGVMNSDVAAFVITAGRTKTPKGSYTINEDVLDDIPIPIPPDRETFRSVVDATGNLVAGKDTKASEAEINSVVFACIGLDIGERTVVESWTRELSTQPDPSREEPEPADVGDVDGDNGERDLPVLEDESTLS